MIDKTPYFLENKDWYYYDKEAGMYKLTSNAPAEAVKSYNDFYAEKSYVDENGVKWVEDY